MPGAHKKQVKYIFLLALKESDDEHLPIFTENFLDLLFNEQKFKKIAKNFTYQTLSSYLLSKTTKKDDDFQAEDIFK